MGMFLGTHLARTGMFQGIHLAMTGMFWVLIWL